MADRSRRSVVLKGCWSLLGMHFALERALARADPSRDPRPSLDAPPRAALRRLRLRSAQLEQTLAFYRDTLEWPIADAASDRFTLLAGSSELLFEADLGDERPFYHFAFNIPRNQFDAAKAWLASRVALVRAPDGRDQFHFGNRDADACYWIDPSGNLGELIAHHRLHNAHPGAFSPAVIQDCCEIGIVVPRVADAVDWIAREIGATPYTPPTDSFAQVGDERGFLIVVPRDRLWFPQQRVPAIDAPLVAELAGLTGPERTVPGTRSRLIAAT